MKNELKQCNCQVTLPLFEYNKMVEYIKKLENAVGKSCSNCVGCENEINQLGNGACDSWVWNGETND